MSSLAEPTIVVCKTCRGDGIDAFDKRKECLYCQGTGQDAEARGVRYPTVHEFAGLADAIEGSMIPVYERMRDDLARVRDYHSGLNEGKVHAFRFVLALMRELLAGRPAHTSD